MLLFVTSIRHPFNSNSFPRVVHLLEHTLRSVCNQNCDNFRVVVVYNELPPLRYNNPNIDFLQVEFPPGSQIAGAETPLQDCQIDKGFKNALGLVHGRRYRPSHVMFFDADDYLHQGLAQLVRESPDAHGWYAEQGWVLRHGDDRIRCVQPFHQASGTSIILRDDLLNLPILETHISYETLKLSVDNAYIRLVFGSHRHTVQHYSDRGLPLCPFPFAPAVWVLEHGENHSGAQANIGKDERPVDESFRETYGLPDPADWP